MPIKIAICDDVNDDRKRLMSIIKLDDFHCECTDYESGEELLWDLESGTHFDIFFLDIYMNGLSGLEVAKRIRSIDQNALLIFVSSSNDFYRESYDLYAFNYLIKPLTGDKLTEVMRRAISHLGKYADQLVHFSFNNNYHTVHCSQLLYLTSEQRVVIFKLVNGKTLKSYSKIDDLLNQLPEEDFVRCHQSYIVNLKHVSGMTSSEFLLGNARVPISRKYSVQVREQYGNHMFRDF